MRIALASFIAASTSTGMGKWTERIGSHLRARGHEVASIDATSLALDLGSSVQRHLFGITVARWLLGQSKRFDAAVVHEPHALPVWLARRFTGTAVVVMSHGLENRILQDLRVAARRGAARLSLARAIRHQVLWGWREAAGLRAAEQVLCLAEVDRRYLLTQLKKSPDQVTCFVNGADPVSVPFDAGASEEVLVVGTWIPEKGSMLLPRIWRAVRNALPGARLTIAGSGAGPDEVLKAFSREDWGSVRVVPSFAGEDQLRALLGGAGVFLLPSLREGSPLALLEAMSHGLPAVASAVGGVPEILSEGAGHLYEPLEIDVAARHVRTLLENLDLRRKMGSAARERAQTFSWESAASAVERACKRVSEVR